jgi:hypothetical protein
MGFVEVLEGKASVEEKFFLRGKAFSMAKSSV